MITKEQATEMSGIWYTHTEFHSSTQCNSDGTCKRWRRNGQTKTWKTRPDEFSIPVKFGLRSYGYITESNAHSVHLASECPQNKEGN